MRIYRIYVIDFFIKIFYALISYLFCWIIFFNNIEILFLFEAFPLLYNWSTKRFIVTHITHLFNITLFLCTFYSFILISPLIFKYTSNFFYACWYSYQHYLYKKMINIFFYSWSVLFLVSHLIFFPFLMIIFLYWEIIKESSLLRIESEFSFFFYIKWLLSVKWFIPFFLTILIISLYLLFLFNSILLLYCNVLYYKKFCLFLFLVFLFLLIPPDLLIQISITLLSNFFIEILFWLICFKLYFKLS